MKTSEDPLRYLMEVGKEYLDKLNALMRKERFSRIRRVTGTGNIVLEIDLRGDEALRETIAEHGIPVMYISEETREVKIGSGSPKYFFIADPLDGSRNFLRGIPFYSFSLALSEVKKKPRLSDVIAGLVVDIPHNEIFSILRRDMKKRTWDTGKHLISFYAYERKVDPRFFKLCSSFGVRGLGSIALEICYVAEGRLDAVVDVRGISRAIDIAGAYPLLRRAGGTIVDLNGGELNPVLDPIPKLSFIAIRSGSLKDEILNLMG